MQIALYAVLAAVLSGFIALSVKRCALLRGQCPDFLRGGAFAHRGLHDGSAQENTLSAFERAIERGFAIELDVRRAKDGTPMVVHDNRLTRLTGQHARLSRLSRAEIKALTRTGERIPSLVEALAFVAGRTPLLIEIKPRALPGAFERDVADMLSAYEGKFAVLSFSPFTLACVKKRCPGIHIGLLMNGFSAHCPRFARVAAQNLLLALCRPAFIVYRYPALMAGEMDIYRNERFCVLGYDIPESQMNTPDARARVDGAIFDTARKPE